MPSGEEFDLWIRFKSGDRIAFAEIYDRYAGVLYNYGFHINPDQDIVSDAIQDLFVTLWQSRERLSDTTSIKYYLFRSLRRQITKSWGEYSQNRVPVSDFTDFLFAEPSIETQVIEVESLQGQRKELQAALMKLSDRQLEAIRLHFYEGFDLKSIALIMEMNEQSVRNLLQRSLQKLRHVLHLLPFVWVADGVL